LILAGDLWVGTRFIEHAGHSWVGYVASKFKNVVIVLGNHDYWPGNHAITILDGADKARGMLQDHGLFNVHILDMTTIVIDDVLIVGATLWTDMNRGDPLTMHNMPNFMSYDGKIGYEHYADGQGFSRFTSNKWVMTHDKHKNYIKHVVEANRDTSIVVVTHHFPLHHLGDPRYIGDNSNYYYSSDMSEFILDNPHIKAWFFGHTHYQRDEMFGETRMYNNAVGYAGEMMEMYEMVKHEVLDV
jgi:predicted phosphohydrolase